MINTNMLAFVKTEKVNLVIAVLVLVLSYIAYDKLITIDENSFDRIIDKTFTYGITVCLFAITLFPVTIRNLQTKVEIKKEMVSFKDRQPYKNIISFYQILILTNIAITALSFIALCFCFQYYISLMSIAVGILISLVLFSTFILYILANAIIGFARLKTID